MKRSVVSVRFKMDDKGVLSPETDRDKLKMDGFKKSLKPGQSVEVFMDANVDDGTLAQLAKVHACIREIADDTGNSFEDVKLEVKKLSGLCVVKELDDEKYMVCKSFSVCSKKELSSVMDTIMDLGDSLGINLR